MVLNPDYNSDDDWDMVSPGDGVQNNAEREKAAGDVCEVPPTAPPPSSEEDLVAVSTEAQDTKEVQVTNVEAEAASNAEIQGVTEAEKEAVNGEDMEIQEKVSTISPADTSLPATEVVAEANTTDSSPEESVAPEKTDAIEDEIATPLVATSLAAAPDPKAEASTTTTTTTTTTDATSPPHRPKPQTPRAVSAWSLLGSSLKKVGSALQDLDQKHDLKLQQTARHSLRVVQSSAQQLGHVVETETKHVVQVVESESRKLSQSVQTKAEEMDLDTNVKVVEARAFQAASVVERNAKQLLGGTWEKGVKTAGASLQRGAKNAREKAQDLNKDGKVTEILTAVAVLGAGVLLAKKGASGSSSSSSSGGNPGAAAACGAAVLGAAVGATYIMASQAVQERNTRRYEATLDEDLHME